MHDSGRLGVARQLERKQQVLGSNPSVGSTPSRSWDNHDLLSRVGRVASAGRTSLARIERMWASTVLRLVPALGRDVSRFRSWPERSA